MLLASIFSWGTFTVVFCLLILLCGLVRLTTRRQTEILKEYFQPEKLQIEQIIMRSGKMPTSPSGENEQGHESLQQQPPVTP